MLWKHEVVGSSPAYPTKVTFGCDVCEAKTFGPPWVLRERHVTYNVTLWLCTQCALTELQMMLSFGDAPSNWYVVDARLGVD